MRRGRCAQLPKWAPHRRANWPPGSWQTPQGGINGGNELETVVDAAIRGIYEEVGLEVGNQVLLEDMDREGTSIKCKLNTEGTES